MTIKVKESLNDICCVYAMEVISGSKNKISEEKCFIVCGGNRTKVKIPLSNNILFTGNKEDCIDYCNGKCNGFEIIE